MLVRKHFITNSSSTGFVAWGVIIPKKGFETLPDFSEEKDSYTKNIAVLRVSDKERMVCPIRSLTRLSTELEDGCIDEGVYFLEKHDKSWRAKCTATLDYYVEEPGSSYESWEQLLLKFTTEHDLYPTNKPAWIHVRTYE